MNPCLTSWAMGLAIGLVGISTHAADLPAELADRKTYDCRYHDALPWGVAAWSQAQTLRDELGGESQFVEYNSQAAAELVNDATTERSGQRDAHVTPRQTTFWQAYNDRGWYLYIESAEPELQAMLDAAINPDRRTPARQESLEIFFAPGLFRVPYYQIFERTVAGLTDHYDWAMPDANYRSLKAFAKVESQPVAEGMGTFIFIPWEAIYESVPLEGDVWRFNIVRWMPFAKAGGVSWRGKVHDTGNFGLVRMHKPALAQKQAIERRLVRYAWAKFQATSSQLKTFWGDEVMGDADFLAKVVEPEIDTAATWQGASMPPQDWTPDVIAQAWPMLKRWMEFDYHISEKRTGYLLDKRFFPDR